MFTRLHHSEFLPTIWSLLLVLCSFLSFFHLQKLVITQMFLQWSVNDFCSYNYPLIVRPLLACYRVFMAQNWWIMQRTFFLFFLCLAISNMVLSPPDFRSVHIRQRNPSRVFHFVNSAFFLSFRSCVAATLRNQRWLQLDRQRKSYTNDWQLIKLFTKTICWPPIWIANESVARMRYGRKKASMGLSAENWLLPLKIMITWMTMLPLRAELRNRTSTRWSLFLSLFLPMKVHQ